MFPTVSFCARQILKIVGFQIEMKRIFSLVEILSSFRRYHLQQIFLDKLIFLTKVGPMIVG
jgi:hypothetical protein